jgi:septum formation protein
MNLKLMCPLILASGSPRRQQLLRESGFEFEIVIPDIDESIHPGWELSNVAETLAKQKCDFVYGQLNRNEVQLLAADTIVIIDGEILGKPGNADEASYMLRRLSGNEHEVHTGICLKGPVTKSATCITKVRFLPLTEAEIGYYLTSCSPYDKAGSYGVQEWLGHCKIDHISGSFPNVMGLPVHLVYQFLRPIMEGI